MERPSFSVRAALVLSTCGLVLSSCGVPGSATDGVGEPTTEIGGSCSSSLDIDPLPNYFADVAVLDVAASQDFRNVVADSATAPVGDVDVTSKLADMQHQEVVVWQQAELLGSVIVDESRRSEAEALPSGSDVYYGIATPGTDSDAYVTIIAIARSDGDLAFVGECANAKYRNVLVNYQREARPDSSLLDTMIAVIGDDEVWEDFNDWYNSQGAYAPLPFAERDPKSRSIDVEDPDAAELIAGMSQLQLTVTVPTSWLEIDGAALCTFIHDVGWNECAAFEAYDGNLIDLSGFFDSTGTIELYLVDYKRGGISAPEADLGEISSLKTEVMAVTVSDSSSSSSFASIREAISTDKVVISVP